MDFSSFLALSLTLSVAANRWFLGGTNTGPQTRCTMGI